MFLEKFALDAWKEAESNGRRQIKYQDLSEVRENQPALIFLEAIIPPPG
jgi:hypothetical protein